MRGYRFHPTFWPSVVTLPALAVLLGLGGWQLDRMGWKQALIAEREAALTAPPVAPPPAIDGATRFRRIEAVGRFDHAAEALVIAAGPGGVAGYQVITPLVLEEGGSLLVDRGWVPMARKAPDSRAAAQIDTVVTLGGLARPSAVRRRFQPANDPDTDTWFSVDVPALAARAGLTDTRPYYLEADDRPNPGGYPKGHPAVLDLPNNHLQYALTWFALAVGLAVIYVVYHLRPLRAEADHGR